MPKKPIKSAEDVYAFFDAYNSRNWKALFSYMDDNVVWDASEQRLHGRDEMMNYWQVSHQFIDEKLAKPYNIVISDRFVHLEVLIHMDFIQDGEYFGKHYKKGEYLEFLCADIYQLNEEKLIEEGRVYLKFIRTKKNDYIKNPELDYHGNLEK